MRPLRVRALVSVFLLGVPMAAAAQDRAWHVDAGPGQAVMVDDSPKRYLVLATGVRRSLSPRVSIGPEVVVMQNSRLVTDRLVMVTGNVTFEFTRAGRGASPRLVPFIVGGAGALIGRDLVRGGPYWHTDLAFTAGAGARVRLTDALSLGGEYRFGWELHQRLSGVCTFAW